MKAQIPWLRVFVEGVVIVGSILLAFGIDVGARDLRGSFVRGCQRRLKMSHMRRLKMSHFGGR